MRYCVTLEQMDGVCAAGFLDQGPVETPAQRSVLETGILIGLLQSGFGRLVRL